MTKTLVEQYTSTLDGMRKYQQERAIMYASILIEQAMQSSGISRARLAGKLDVSKTWVNKLLDSDGNVTIRVLADVMAVMGYEIRFIAPAIQISNSPKKPAPRRKPPAVMPKRRKINEGDVKPRRPIRGKS